MSVNTKTAEGRRTLHFDTLDDIVADVEVLRAHGYEKVGNWSLGQVCEHLSRTMNYCIDGFDITMPLPIRLVGPLVRGWMLKRGFPPGIQLKGPTDKMRPMDAVADDAGVEMLHRAVARLKAEPQRQPSPVLGRLSAEQWTRFHCRHAELHLSFLKPKS